MKVLVTGQTGQLARSLLERSERHSGLQVVAVGRPELDLEEPGSAGQCIAAARPDLVINAAAYTAVDQAEAEPDRAFRINAAAAGEVAAAARKVGARVIQISTDYVFIGAAERPWLPDDRTGPLGVYGASKLAGEEAVRAANPGNLIVRTSWVFGPFGRNFVTTMLRLAGERDEVQVVADQRGCPTSSLDLADALLQVAERWSSGDHRGVGATYHLAGSGEASWCEFAGRIMAEFRAAGLPSAEVRPIATADWPTPARRPLYSVLSSEAFERDFGTHMPAWPDSLKEVVGRLAASLP